MSGGVVATFGSGSQTGIPISGSFGGGSGTALQNAAAPIQPAYNPAQNTMTTSNQYLLGNNGNVLSDSTGSTSGNNNAAAANGPIAGTQNGLLLGQAYDEQLNNLRGQLSQIDPMQQNATNDIYKGYNDQNKMLQDNYAYGQNQHQSAQQGLDLSHTNGVRDLGNQLRTSLQGYQNQLGVQGAGNSSAAGLLGYALQQEGNRSMDDMNNQYNVQQGNLNAAGVNLDKQFQNSQDQLNTWRDTQIHQLVSMYQGARSQIEQQMSQNLVSKAYALQQNQALAQQTLDQMKAIDAGYAGQNNALMQSYHATQAAPGADLSATNGFNYTNVSNPGVSQLAFGNTQSNGAPTNVNVPVSLQRKDITQPF